MPWEAIKTLLLDTVYGGKIDRTEDSNVLRQLIDAIFQAEAYNIDFSLVSDGSVTAPEGSGLETFIEWVEQLPNRQPPEWLGLPSAAEKSMREFEAEDVAINSILVLDSLA